MMDTHRSSLLPLAYSCQGKNMEELRLSLLYTTLELEQTKLAVEDELRKRDEQIFQLKDLLTNVIRERDDAQEKSQRFLFENLLLQQQLQKLQNQPQNAPLSGVSTIDDEPRRGIDSNNGFSSSDCDESIVSSPLIDPLPQPTQLPPGGVEILTEKPLPEKGKLLQAVMKAGPLLQTLLLAGPLPQWRHPPPPLESFEIPPVTIPPPPPAAAELLHQDSIISVSRKRVLCDGSDSPTQTKFQRTLLH